MSLEFIIAGAIFVSLTFYVLAGGADIWGASDQGHLTLGAHVGDFDMSMQVTNLVGVDPIEMPRRVPAEDPARRPGGLYEPDDAGLPVQVLAADPEDRRGGRSQRGGAREGLANGARQRQPKLGSRGRDPADRPWGRPLRLIGGARPDVNRHLYRKRSA